MGTSFLNLPPRMTNYTRTKFDKFKKGLPFISKLNEYYKNLVPEVFNKQYSRAALHVDSGNFNGGMAVMTVLERGKYSGGYTVFPQYGIGFDVRHGDVLVMENCNTCHANTEI